MTRFQVLLAFALLTVACFLVLTLLTGGGAEAAAPQTVTEAPTVPPLAMADRPVSTTESDRGPRTFNRREGQKDRTFYGVSYANPDDAEAAARVQADSQARLDHLSDEYGLSPTQRREIFPLIAVHHPEFNRSMLVNGQEAPELDPVPVADGEKTLPSLETSLYPLLTPRQQDRLQHNVLEKGRWWDDVLGQLDTDLERAFANGEILAESPATTDPESEPELDAPSPP